MHDDTHGPHDFRSHDPHRRDGRRERERSRERRRDARKERVLHTRISEDLADDIRRIADELRVPVSNIVRNVLEEAFSVVETVTGNVGDLIEDVVDEAEAAAERIRRQRERRRARAEGPRDVTGARADSEPASERPAAASDPESDVLGWQPLVLARPQRCADCGDALPRGEQAWAAVTGAGIGSRYLCEACLDAREERA